jgi:hypothetical protein
VGVVTAEPFGCDICGYPVGAHVVGQPHPGPQSSLTDADLLGQSWHAVPNVLIGGWCVLNRDLPDNDVGPDHRDDGVREIGDFLSEAIARHIVWLHQAALGEAGWTAPDLRARIADLEAQLAARSHEAIVARGEAEVAKGILRKVSAAAGRCDGWIGRTDGPIDLTDAEAALFDTITEESK